jgi:hypothetical protein
MIITQHLPLECKSLSDWHEEVNRHAYRFREKYERCFRSQKYSVEIIRFYNNTYKIYTDVAELLYHLKRYRSLNSDDCLSCKHTPHHVQKLEYNYKKYYKSIMRCRDGDRYSYEAINAI